MIMQQEIAVVILFYNKLEQTKLCIESFLPSGATVYVLNNGTAEDQWKKLQSFFDTGAAIIFLDARQNLGVSGGRNYLIRHSTEPWIFSVDNDIVVKGPAEWKQRLEDFIAANPSAKIICPKLYNVHDQSYSLQLNVLLNDKTMILETGEMKISNCFPGGASIVNRDIFDKYGLFDENMFVGFEDYEFSLRALKQFAEPLQAFACDSIELIHDHQFQKKQSDKEAVKQRYNDEKLRQSYTAMVNKHQVSFEHHWERWTKGQVTKMTASRTSLLYKRLVNKLKKWKKG